MSELSQRALRLLARREHTRAELEQKLAPHGTPHEIEALLDSLAQSGLQSDARYAENFVATQAARLGAAQLRFRLRQKGIAEDLIAAALTRLDDEVVRARQVWAKKFGTAPCDAREWARQARFLQGRGFSSSVIRQVLGREET